MSENSPIEWTTHTFNPWWGCARVSPGCDHCYAERDAGRFKPGIPLWGTPVDGAVRFVWPEGDEHHVTAQANMMNAAKHWGAPLSWNAHAAARGVRDRVFCASMADVFDNHPGVTEERERLWTLIHKTRSLDWQLLTKRVGNVWKMVPESWMTGHWPTHAWMGISVVNQEEADRDIPKLLALPARIRFLSIEPMLGPIDLRDGLGLMGCPGDLDWIIAGGESGPQARPANPQWYRDLRDQCATAGVPFLFKQNGEWVSVSEVAGEGRHFTFPDGATVRRVGKRAAGRTLDGVTHDGVPT